VQGTATDMSELHNKPSIPDTMPFTEEDKALARQKQQEAADAKKKKRNKLVASVAGGAVLLAGGAVAGLKFAGGPAEKEKQPQGQELVLGPDGQPVEYVEFKYDPEYYAEYEETGNYPDEIPEGMDRNHDGTEDNLTDVNENGVNDSEELWDQLDNEFVDPLAEGSAEIEANASEQDKEYIAEIESVIPDFAELFGVHWKAEFIQLDPIVKERVMFALRHPGEYVATESATAEQNWRADVYYQFSRTPEEIQN
jgi:hypothetical protein